MAGAADATLPTNLGGAVTSNEIFPGLWLLLAFCHQSDLAVNATTAFY